MKAIQIIRDEHRALAAVLHGLNWVTRDIREKGAAPDFELLAAMAYYIDAFPERFHHPKEDRYLFARLRERCPAAATTLDALQAEHAEGARRMRDLEQALTRYRAGGAAEYAPFAAAVEAFTTLEYAHMRREEREVLPLAEAHLTPDDWAVIDEAFLGHTDPLLGEASGTQWQRLFTRIVSLAPAPIGVGPERGRDTSTTGG